MRFLSLFSGIEAASVAWRPLGWRRDAVDREEDRMSSGTVKDVVRAALRAARERYDTWNEISSACRKAFDSQQADDIGLHSADLEVCSIGRCPHPGLAGLWAELEDVLQDGDVYGGAWIDGDDFSKIVALVPSWLPAWAKKLQNRPQTRPCSCCGGRGWVEAEKEKP